VTTGGASDDEALTDSEIATALQVARRLIAAGVPMFVAKPDPTQKSGYQLPLKWDTARPLLDVVDRWRPGWALCAVGGHVCDFLDVDVQNGGDVDEAGLRDAGMWPRSYGRARSPSGGTHDIIAPLRTGKGRATAGIDLQGGLPEPDAEGETRRGFVFISPTVRARKPDGVRRPYRWIVEPDMDLLAEDGAADDSGRGIADLVAGYRARGQHDQGPPGTGSTAPIDPVGLLHQRVTAFEALTAEGHNRTQELDNLALLAGHGVPRYWSADAARQRLLEAARSNGYIGVHGQRDALVQIDSGLTDGAAKPWLPVDPSERAYRAEVAYELRRLKIRDEAQRQHRIERAGPLVLPTPVLLTDLLAEPDEPTRYRIDGLLPVGGRVVLAAQFKAGKSTVIGNLVRCLADGGEFLGSHLVNPAAGRTVLVDNEMPRETMRLWLRDQGINYTDEIAVIPTRGNVSSFDILSPEVRARWVEMIRGYGPGVLILDCLRPVLDALGLDENSDAGQVLVALDEIAERTGATELIVVHHMGHLNERSRGSSRIRDWPDVEWRLVRKDDDPSSQRFFTAYGRDVDVPETVLEYDPKTRHLTLAGGNRIDVSAHLLVPDLVDLLVDQPGLSGRAIEDKLMDAGIPRSTVRTTLGAAIDEGYVITVPGPQRSTLHHASPIRRPVRRSGQRLSAPVRRDNYGALNEGHPNFSAPQDQTEENAGDSFSAPVRRSAPDLDGALGRVKCAGPVELSPGGRAPTGALNGQVSALEEDRKENDLGALNEDPQQRHDTTLDSSGDRWVHAHLTTAPQTVVRLAADLDASTGAVITALARLELGGHARRFTSEPETWSLPVPAQEVR
jgi:AAA domain